MTPLQILKHHVSGAIERGESTAIAGITKEHADFLARAGSDIPKSVPIEEHQAYLEKCVWQAGVSLPVIIDAIGEYRARSGKKVVIHAIGSTLKSTSNCEGCVIRPKRSGKGFTLHYNTWRANGRNVCLGETSRDIVAKWKTQT